MRFEVTALRGDEGVVRLAFDAASELSAREQARSQGLTVLAAKPATSRWRARRSPFAPRFSPGQFSQELLALLDAGLSLPESLETLAEKESGTEQRRILATLRDALFDGLPLSRALEQCPAAFPPLYVATVRASERTGDLGRALARYVDYQARVDLVRKKVVSASIYPVVLLVVGALVTLFLLAYVVPRFAGVYAESNRELPWLSRLLLEWWTLLNAHGALVAIVAVLGVVCVAIGFRPIARLASELAMRLPAVAERVLVYELARFYRTVSMLLSGGTPLPQALDMVRDMLPPALRERLALAAGRVREGTSVSAAMVGCGLTTPVAARMLRVGERSGDMAGMMERIAVFYDDDIARWIDWFTKLFEPLLMVAIGTVIGVVVVLMYLPIFELAGSLQ